MTSAAVYGTGSWGTAYASVLADAGTSVTMWGRRQEVVDQINAGTNEDYLPELRLPGTIRATTCLLYTSPSPRDRTRSRMPSSA